MNQKRANPLVDLFRRKSVREEMECHQESCVSLPIGDVKTNIETDLLRIT